GVNLLPRARRRDIVPFSRAVEIERLVVKPLDVDGSIWPEDLPERERAGASLHMPLQHGDIAALARAVFVHKPNEAVGPGLVLAEAEDAHVVGEGAAEAALARQILDDLVDRAG